MKTYNPYKVNRSFYLRIPSFSFDFYSSFTKNIDVTDADFKDLFKNKFFIEALYLASPELLKQFKNWAENNLENQKKIELVKLSILKYITRITTRPTPFGLFAGCNMGSFSNTTGINLKDISNYKKFTRLDLSYLSSLIDYISTQPDVKKHLNYHANSSLYKIGNQYRYTAYVFNNKNRVYYLDGTLYSKYLEKVINEAKKGKSLNDLSNLLIKNGIEEVEASNFINELIEKQIIVSELQLMITNKDNLVSLIERLKFLPASSDFYKKIIELIEKIKVFDSKKNPNYENFYNWIKTNFETILVNKKYLLQVDLFIPSHNNTLNNKHINLIKKSMNLLNKITIKYENTRIKWFKNSFLKRYDTEELRLFEVLDTETGFGYNQNLSDDHPFLEDLNLPKKKKISKEIIWTDIDDVFLEKVTQSISENNYVLQLKDDDFKDFEAQWDDLNDTMSSIIEVVNLNSEEILVMNSIGGSSAANLLARFSHNDNKILEHINNITDIEKKINPKVILAEIIHLPQSRTGNILRRPVVREFEIPYLGKSELPIKNQIPIEDIMISIRDNKIVLRSKKLQKKIIPYLTNTHNYRNSLPIYFFLCDLQHQDKRAAIGFQWHNILERLAFLPRVEYNSVIISKARWNIKTSLMIKLFTLKGVVLVEQMKAWRETV